MYEYRSIEDFIVKLDTIWGELAALGDAKVEKRIVLTTIQLTAHSYMTYDELKQAVIAATPFMMSDMDCHEEAVAFQVRTGA